MKHATRQNWWQALTALAIMTFLIAACGGEAATNTPSAPATTVPAAGATATAMPAAGATNTAMPAASTPASGFQGTLQYWVLGYAPDNQTGKLTQAAVAAYKKAHPGIDVEITGYTGDQAGFTKLTQAVQSGSGVDVFRLPSDILPLLATGGFVAPIDDYLTADDKADIYPNILDSVRINGKAYAWPLWVPPVGMYLNLDIFKERNVAPPSPDWTYDQFVQIAKQLTFTRADGTKVYGYSGVIDAGVVNTWPFIYGDGGRPLSDDNKTYTFDSPGAISGLKKLVDLAQVDHVTPPDFGSQTPADMVTGFKDKKVLAMYSEPSGSSATYKAANMNFDVIPMPIGSSGKHVTTGGVGLISVAQQQDKTRVQAGMDFARYLTGKQVADDVQGYYLAPASRKSVTVQPPIDKFVPMVDYTIITPLITQWPQIRTIIHPNIQNAVFGKLTPEDALKKPADEINNLLKQP